MTAPRFLRCLFCKKWVVGPEMAHGAHEVGSSNEHARKLRLLRGPDWRSRLAHFDAELRPVHLNWHPPASADEEVMHQRGQPYPRPKYPWLAYMPEDWTSERLLPLESVWDTRAPRRLRCLLCRKTVYEGDESTHGGRNEGSSTKAHLKLFDRSYNEDEEYYNREIRPLHLKWHPPAGGIEWGGIPW